MVTMVLEGRPLKWGVLKWRAFEYRVPVSSPGKPWTRRRRGRPEIAQGIFQDKDKTCEFSASFFLGRALLTLGQSLFVPGLVDRLVGVENPFLGVLHVASGLGVSMGDVGYFGGEFLQLIWRYAGPDLIP
jgi:hypothetical protein